MRSDADGRRLFELASDLLATVASDGRFRELSPAWEDTLGWTLDHLRAVPFLEHRGTYLDWNSTGRALPNRARATAPRSSADDAPAPV